MIEKLRSLNEGVQERSLLGIGDDAAIIDPQVIPQGYKMVIATDTLVAGRHFSERDSAEDIGHKALAVNLSDMAAMGALPKWLTMNLTLPKVDEQWLQEFIGGVGRLLKRYQVELIGGDTTSGPLAIAFTVIGLTPHPKKRSDAQENELIVVSGELGSAAFALQNPGKISHCEQQLKRPMPRFDISEAVREFAGAMIDISDGLVADLGHICQASGLAARIDLDKIPIHAAIKEDADWSDYVLSGGDDYQLCFTIQPADVSLLPSDCTVIGHMQAGSGVSVYNNNQPIQLQRSGFDHFSGCSHE